jgi:carboxylesterase type B
VPPIMPSFLSAVVLAPLSCLALTALASPTVTIDAATYIGTTTSIPQHPELSNAFLGIRFAEPPVRFAPPVPLAPQNGTVDATAYGATCYNTGSGKNAFLLIGLLVLTFTFTVPSQQYPNATYSIKNYYNATQSEDCLTLNIFSPLNARCDSKLAVMVFIYGGDLVTGGSSLTVFDGTYLSSTQNVIVVTLNYRLGLLGFMPSPELPITERNLGFLDQRLALQWVHNNIKAFGGDPEAITVFGQSAGAYSVKQLVANPPHPLPFRAAIMESPGFIAVSNGYDSLLSLANCTSVPSGINCLRQYSASVLTTLASTYSLAFPDTADNVTSTNHVEKTLASKTAAHVPLLVGNNGNEFAWEIDFPNATTTALLWTLTLGSLVSNVSFSTLYSQSLGLNGPVEAGLAMANNYGFICPSKLLTTFSALNGYPTWRYIYNATFANIDSYTGESSYGAAHGEELPSVFGTFPPNGTTAAQQQRLAEYMGGLWSAFAKNPTTALKWPQVNHEKEFIWRIGQGNAAGGSLVDSAVVDGGCGSYDGLLVASGRV